LQNLDDYISANKNQKEKIEKLRTTIARLQERIISMGISHLEHL